MVLEIKEKGTKEFYSEVVNVMFQYKRLSKDPKAKVSNIIRDFALLVCLEIFMIGILIAQQVFVEKDESTPLLVACCFIALVASVYCLIKGKKMTKELLAKDAPGTLVIDKLGVRLDKQDSLSVALRWHNIVLVKICKQSLSFVSNDGSGIIISVAIKYKDAILKELKNLKHDDIVYN